MMWKDNELLIEIPLPRVKNRPLIVAHPASGSNYTAAWNVMIEHGEDFVLVCDDVGPHYPDEWPYHCNEVGAEYFVRMQNSTHGDRIYRNPDLKFDNLLVHRQKTALEGFQSMPLVDVLFVDWIPPFSENTPDLPFKKVAAAMADTCRDGGIILLDEKARRNFPHWFEFEDGEFGLEYLGRAEWPIPSLEMTQRVEISAEVFRVHNTKKQADVDDFLSTLTMERRMSPKELKLMRKRIPRRNDSLPDKDIWWERKFDSTFHQGFDEPEWPMPQASPWDFGRYKLWIDDLIKDSKRLRPISREIRSVNVGFEVQLIHGDIADHLDWLFLNNNSIILRRKHMVKCLERCPMLGERAIKLQPKWEDPLIQEMKWSGNESTPDLTSKLLDLSKDEINVATIAHSQANLEQLLDQCSKWKKENPNSPLESFTIFYLDEADYQ
ncbi:MAG TPA: hypothetical protein EYG33_06080 [Candidatus Poseidoniales archaeon]|nr:hypothetical protein [Candidatus Poseidoniales archaeon]